MDTRMPKGKEQEEGNKKPLPPLTCNQTDKKKSTIDIDTSSKPPLTHSKTHTHTKRINFPCFLPLS